MFVFRIGRMTCIACCERDAYALTDTCGHASLCAQCAAAFHAVDFHASLACPLCRGPSFAWPGCPASVAVVRFASFLRTADHDERTTAVVHNITLRMECEYPELAAIARGLRRCMTGKSCEMEDYQAVYDMMRMTVEHAPSSAVAAWAAYNLQESPSIADRRWAVIGFDANPVSFMTHALTTPDVMRTCPEVRSRALRGIVSWRDELQAIAVRFLALDVPDDTRCIALYAAIPCVRGNPALASAVVHMVASAPADAVPDDVMTRLAEALLYVNTRAIHTHYASVRNRLLAYGVTEEVQSDRSMVLTNLRRILVDTGPRTSPLCLCGPFCPSYELAVRMGGIPVFNVEGDVVDIRGVHQSCLQAFSCCRKFRF